MSALLHWLLRSVGKALPCYVVFAVSYGGEIAHAVVFAWLWPIPVPPGGCASP